MQSDENERNENVNCFLKILQMKMWDMMRDEVSNVHVGQSNLIYMVDRFASEEEITECNMQEIASENKDG